MKRPLKSKPLIVFELISDEEIDAILTACVVADQTPTEFHEAFCDQRGYYDELREEVRDIVWARYSRLRNWRVLKIKPAGAMLIGDQ